MDPIKRKESNWFFLLVHEQSYFLLREKYWVCCLSFPLPTPYLFLFLFFEIKRPHLSLNMVKLQGSKVNPTKVGQETKEINK